jgi:hypothetical protein
MIERYRVLASRIRQELSNLEQVVARAERAMTAMRQHQQDQDLYLDATALNLHDFYAGLERSLHQIAATVDRSVPSGREWHRELLRQMTVAVPQIRPQVLSAPTAKAVDEFLRFRHIVRNVYALDFESERIEQLTRQLRPTFQHVKDELLAFADFLEQLTPPVS